MSEKYGEIGKEYRLGEQTLKVDDDFVLATLLAIVGVLAAHIPQIDDHISVTASRIYEEIKKQQTENS